MTKASKLNLCKILLFILISTLLVGCMTTFKATTNYDIAINELICEPKIYNKSIINENLENLLTDIELTTTQIIVQEGLSGFNVKFPQINNHNNEIFFYINRLIYDMVITDGNVNGVSYDISKFKDIWVDVEISYRIVYISDNLISIHFSGSLSGGGVGVRGFSGVQKAITIDLETGTILSLSDFFTKEELENIIEELLLSEGSRFTRFTSSATGENLENSFVNTAEILNSYNIELFITQQTLFFNNLLESYLLSDTRYFYILENGVGLIGGSFPASATAPVIFEITLGYTPSFNLK